LTIAVIAFINVSTSSNQGCTSVFSKTKNGP
jgi:hypothetical protein